MTAGRRDSLRNDSPPATEERILAVEYTLTDRFSLLLTRTDPGTGKTGTEKGWAFDVRIRQSR